MKHFSELGNYQKDVRDMEIENFNIWSTQRGLTFSKWTLIISVIALFVSIASFIVALIALLH